VIAEPTRVVRGGLERTAISNILAHLFIRFGSLQAKQITKILGMLRGKAIEAGTAEVRVGMVLTWCRVLICQPNASKPIAHPTLNLLSTPPPTTCSRAPRPSSTWSPSPTPSRARRSA
jgi:hypothetical protein